MPKSILTIISKDGNATEYYEKSVVTEHISKMEPLKEKFPKLYFYKFVIANLGQVLNNDFLGIRNLCRSH